MNQDRCFHTLSLKVCNKPGVLLRIAAIFSRRGFNIESLVVSPTQDGQYSRMTIVAEGDIKTLEQIIKQVSKLVDVLEASEPDTSRSIEKELALIRIKSNEQSRSSVLQIVQHFKAQTVDITHDSLVVQVTGSSEKLDACQRMLSKFGIIELVRTGKVLMTYGSTEG